MKYFAVLKDAVAETLDRKSLYVMMVVSGLFILLCASISFSELSPEGAVSDMVRTFGRVIFTRPMSMDRVDYESDFTVSDVRKLGPEPGRLAGAYEFTLVSGKPMTKVARHLQALRSGAWKKEGDAIPDVDKDLTPAEEEEFIRARFREKLIPFVEAKVTERDGDRRTFAVRMRPMSPELVEGSHKIHAFFGLASAPLSMSVAAFVASIERFLAKWLAGWAGTVIAIIFTAGFIPNMLQKGSLDLMLARPISRSALLFYRYLGGLSYAVISGTIFIGGSWLMLSLRSGVWNWGYLASLGTLTAYFAILYSFGVLIAVLTRSTVASILMPIGLWFVSMIVNVIRMTVDMVRVETDVPAWADRLINVFYYPLPKPNDFDNINSYLMWRSTTGGEGKMPFDVFVPDWASTGVSSLAFAGIMLGLACWIFSRRDY